MAFFGWYKIILHSSLTRAIFYSSCNIILYHSQRFSILYNYFNHHIMSRKIVPQPAPRIATTGVARLHSHYVAPHSDTIFYRNDVIDGYSKNLVGSHATVKISVLYTTLNIVINIFSIFLSFLYIGSYHTNTCMLELYTYCTWDWVMAAAYDQGLADQTFLMNMIMTVKPRGWNCIQLFSRDLKI